MIRIKNLRNFHVAFRISLYIVAALLLGAHFLRSGEIAASALCLAAPLLFLYRKRWSLIMLRFLAYGAAGSWSMTAVLLVRDRLLSGRAWILAAVILGAVALLSLAAGLMLHSRSIAERYPE